MLCSKDLFTQDYEKQLDNVKIDGTHILNDCMDWESSGPVNSFAKLREDLYMVQQNFASTKNKVFPFGLVYTLSQSRKELKQEFPKTSYKYEGYS